MQKKKEKIPSAAPTGAELQIQFRLGDLMKKCCYLNSKQRSVEYGISYGGRAGETFALFCWSGFEQREEILVPAGTPVTEAKLEMAKAELRKHWEKMNFGRWKAPWPE